MAHSGPSLLRAFRLGRLPLWSFGSRRSKLSGKILALSLLQGSRVGIGAALMARPTAVFLCFWRMRGGFAQFFYSVRSFLQRRASVGQTLWSSDQMTKKKLDNLSI